MKIGARKTSLREIIFKKLYNSIHTKNSFFNMVISLPPYLHMAGTAHCVTVEEQSSNPRHNIIE